MLRGSESLKTPSPIFSFVAGNNGNEVASLVASEPLPLDSSMLYEFTIEFKGSNDWFSYWYSHYKTKFTTSLPGISIFWHSMIEGEKVPSILGSGKFGYEGIGKSLALGIQPYNQPYSRNAVIYSHVLQLLQNGKIDPDTVIQEKWGGVIPRNFVNRKLDFSLRYLSGVDKKFILDVKSDGAQSQLAQ